MKAGAVRAEITPPAGLHMAGFGARTEPARGAHDPLYVRALVLEGSQGCAALVAADLIHVPEHIQDEVIRAVSARTPIGREQIQLVGTHTHGGPAVIPGSEYSAALAAAMADAVVQAWEQRREALAGVSTGTVGGIGKNRRHPEGPVDHDVTVLRIDDTAGRGIATLVNYSCHPTTLGPDNLLYTADYPGVACAEIDREAEGIAIFTTGAQGDVNPGGYSAEGSMIGHVVPWRNYQSAEQYGKAVARVALEVRGRLRPEPGDRVWGRSRVLELSRKELPSAAEAQQRMEAAREAVLKAQASGTREELTTAQLAYGYAQVTLHQAKAPDRDQPVRVRVSALALGPATHVGIAGELFAELGMQIKRAVGQGATFVAVLSDGSIGYIPTRQAFAEGGYEPAASVLLPGGGEAITEAAIGLATGPEKG
ncbi:MAG: neutral/alkaline non-lysosomal ceramidase N-terminal domain-containing protein [Bacillota bacterium]